MSARAMSASRLPPGSAVPRVSTAARVVAANGSRSGIISSASGDCAFQTPHPNTSAHGGVMQHETMHTTAMPTDGAQHAYVPYVHVSSGECRLVLVGMDSVTGMAYELAPTPDSFVPSPAVQCRIQRAPPVQSCFASFLGGLANCLRGGVQHAPASLATPTPSAPTSRRVTPAITRQLAFPHREDEEQTSVPMGQLGKMSTSELASIEGRGLELENVPTLGHLHF